MWEQVEVQQPKTCKVKAPGAAVKAPQPVAESDVQLHTASEWALPRKVAQLAWCG